MMKRKHSACASSCSPAVSTKKKHWIVQINEKKHETLPQHFLFCYFSKLTNYYK